MTHPSTNGPEADSAKHLSELIERAFVAVPYPGDDNIVAIQPHDRMCEEAHLTSLFKGRHWKDLGLSELMQDAELSGLTPEAFRFYLPAYLLAVVNHYWESDVLPEYMAWRMDPEKYRGSTHSSWFSHIVAALDREQRDAVRAYFEFLRDEHGDDLAIYDIDFDRIIQFYAALEC